jgi:hypothetical protein
MVLYFCAINVDETDPWAQSNNTFYGRDLLMLGIMQIVCPWQAFPV